MAGLSRRTFLAVTAGAAGAAIGAPPRAAAAATAEPLTGTLTDAKHIVILMQENRSFDHYFGTLKGVRGFGDLSTILTTGGHSVFDQVTDNGRQFPWRLSSTTSSGHASPEILAQCSTDLAHSWSDQHAAWHDGTLDAWVDAKGVRSMGYLARSDIPFHFALADNWTINDAYFCSALSATGPNRTYHWSGWIDPDGTAGGPAYSGGDESGLRWETYAEALQRAGVTWRLYQVASDNYGDNALAYFTQFTSAPAGSPLAVRGMGSVPRVTGRTPDDIVAGLRADVLAGALPQVSWIVPNQEASEHPQGTPADGIRFVHGIMDALNADPAVWDSTILLLNYDENDGYFDHVPPPAAPPGTPDEFYAGENIGPGFRVPLIAISPWSRGGWVSSQVSDHTSVLRFLETWTAAIGRPATCPNISAWRRRVCSDLTGMFDFANPVFGMPTLPSTPAIGMATCSSLPSPTPQDNALPVQEPGTKPARALPYQPSARLDRIVTGDDGVVTAWITMSNSGSATTSLAAYANAHRLGGPWSYPIDAAASTEDFFNIGSGFGDGAYDLSVIGPNRFLRRFEGNATTPGRDVSVVESYEIEQGTGELAIWFEMTNRGTTQVTFTISSANYRWDGPWTYRVDAGMSARDYFNAAAYTDGWYDFTVTVDSDSTWKQRFTGHLETGMASVTG